MVFTLPLENPTLSLFNIQTGIRLGPANTLMINKDTMVVNSDYLPMFFSANGNFYSGEAVFVGIITPHP